MHSLSVWESEGLVFNGTCLAFRQRPPAFVLILTDINEVFVMWIFRYSSSWKHLNKRGEFWVNAHKLLLSYTHTHTHTLRNSSSGLCFCSRWFKAHVLTSESQATVVCSLLRQMRHEPSTQSLHHPANCTSCSIRLLATRSVGLLLS